MIAMFHVTVALASIALTTFAYLAPSQLKLRVSYGLVATTLMSGFYLVWSEPAHMLQSCMMGVAYIAAISLGIFAARRKLIVQEHSV